MLLALVLCAGCTSTPDPGPPASTPSTPEASTGRILFQAFTDTLPDTLFTMRSDGTDVQQLALAVDDPAISADWSPDGRKVVFVLQQPDGVQTIWVAEADGSHARELIDCPGDCLSLDYPAWSPDGRSIAFTRYDAEPPPTAGPPSGDEIRVFNIAAGRDRVLARSSFPQLLDLPRWSPDGTRLVVQTDRFAADGTETGSRLAVVGVSDGRVHPITPFATFAFHPDWSPRGNKITYATYDFFVDPPPGHASNIFTIDPDGTHVRQLTRIRPSDDETVAQPTFAPNGRDITFTHEHDSVRRAALITIRGGPLREVSDVFATHPRLAPTSP